MLDALLPAILFHYALVFARVGAMLMVLPGFGDQMVLLRLRLILAVLLAVLVTPLIPALPELPAAPVALLPLVGGEVLIGLAAGGLARIIVASLHVAGTVIAVQSGLAVAQNIDPSQGSQSVVPANFMILTGTVLIFVTNLHHLLIEALVQSYSLFPVGQPAPLGDFARLATDTVAATFLLGLQMAAPFLIFGIVFNLLLGLMNRLMPMVQVFFIALPLQVPASFLIFAATIGLTMTLFTDRFVTLLGPLVP